MDTNSTFIIAELSANHNGCFDSAAATIRAAANVGADAIKLQTYTADTITIDHDGPGFIIEDGLWKGRSLHGLYSEAHTPWDWHKQLFEVAKDAGLCAFPVHSTIQLWISSKNWGTPSIRSLRLKSRIFH